MANIVDFSTTNSQVTDEVINVPDSNAINLAHDLFYNKTGKLVVISTAAGGGGTVLTITTDYTLGGIFADADLPTSISPDDAYSTVAITNATYHNTDLYVAYYPISDLYRAGRWNTLSSPDEDAALDISASNQTYDLTIPRGQPQDYEFIVRFTGGDGSNTFSFTNDGGATINNIAASEFIGRGTGCLHIRWDKANNNLKVLNYVWDRDAGNFGSSDTFKKNIDGTLEQTIDDTSAATPASRNFVIAFANSNPKIIGSAFSSNKWAFNYSARSASAFTPTVYTLAGGYVAENYSAIVVGRWTTSYPSLL